MDGLSVAHRTALAGLIGRCGEPVLKTVAAAVARIPGPKAVAESLFAMARDGRLWDAITRSMGRLAQGYGLSDKLGL